MSEDLWLSEPERPPTRRSSRLEAELMRRLDNLRGGSRHSHYIVEQASSVDKISPSFSADPGSGAMTPADWDASVSITDAMTTLMPQISLEGNMVSRMMRGVSGSGLGTSATGPATHQHESDLDAQEEWEDRHVKAVPTSSTLSGLGSGGGWPLDSHIDVSEASLTAVVSAGRTTRYDPMDFLGQPRTWILAFPSHQTVNSIRSDAHRRCLERSLAIRQLWVESRTIPCRIRQSRAVSYRVLARHASRDRRRAHLNYVMGVRIVRSRRRLEQQQQQQQSMLRAQRDRIFRGVESVVAPASIGHQNVAWTIIFAPAQRRLPPIPVVISLCRHARDRAFPATMHRRWTRASVLASRFRSSISDHARFTSVSHKLAARLVRHRWAMDRDKRLAQAIWKCENATRRREMHLRDREGMARMWGTTMVEDARTRRVTRQARRRHQVLGQILRRQVYGEYVRLTARAAAVHKAADRKRHIADVLQRHREITIAKPAEIAALEGIGPEYVGVTPLLASDVAEQAMMASTSVSPLVADEAAGILTTDMPETRERILEPIMSGKYDMDQPALSTVKAAGIGAIS